MYLMSGFGLVLYLKLLSSFIICYTKNYLTLRLIKMIEGFFTISPISAVRIYTSMHSQLKEIFIFNIHCQLFANHISAVIFKKDFEVLYR